MSFPERQYDQSRTHNSFISVPHYVAGRLNALDFVFFNFDSTFPARYYSVAVESMSNASPVEQDRYRVIGRLQDKVELPDVHFSQGFGSHSQIFLLPNSGNLPAYKADLVRGSTYTVRLNSRFSSTKGFRMMDRTGSR